MTQIRLMVRVTVGMSTYMRTNTNTKHGLYLHTIHCSSSRMSLARYTHGIHEHTQAHARTVHMYVPHVHTPRIYTHNMIASASAIGELYSRPHSHPHLHSHGAHTVYIYMITHKYSYVTGTVHTRFTWTFVYKTKTEDTHMQRSSERRCWYIHTYIHTYSTY